jgi:hypothetical protein
VVAWGWNYYGQVSVPPAAQSGVVGVAAGEYHSVAVKADGSVVGWGYDRYGQASIPFGLGQVTKVAAGSVDSIALTAWGSLGFAQSSRSVAENVGTVNLTVTRTGDTTRVASVTYTAMPGTATPADFGLAPGRLIFAADQTSKTISLSITNDTAREGPETIMVSLSAPTPGTVLAAPASTTVTVNTSDQQPDALISTTLAGGYVGNNIFNTTGANQTKTVTGRRTQTRAFYVRVGNDGNVTNIFRLSGSAAGTGSTVKYFSGATNITTAIRSTTGYATTLAPGATKTFKVTITISGRARIGSTKAAILRAAWTGDGIRTDAVKAAVRVIARSRTLSSLKEAGVLSCMDVT